MTTTEMILAFEFLGDLAQRLAEQTSGDFELADTKDNREVVDCAEAANRGMTLEKWRAARDYYPPMVVNGKILTNNVLMVRFIKHQIGSELDALL